MDSAELRSLTDDLSIEADPMAGPRFRSAAARLDGVEPGTHARPPAASEAAELLVGLALGGASDELGELLVPDPSVSENRWTVACYEIGGLTPVTARDFDDPAEAVVTVAACPDEHVAAELVASNENGLRWTALWRTGDLIFFQLPSAETAEAGGETDEDEHSEELLAALRGWRVRLAEWSGRDATASSMEPALPLQLWFPGFPVPETQTAPTPTASTTAVAMAPSRAAAAQLQALEQRMSGIESTLAGLSTELREFTLDAEHREDSSSAAIEHAIDVRFRVLSRVVQSAVDRLGAQLADEPKLRALPTRLVADERRNRG